MTAEPLPTGIPVRVALRDESLPLPALPLHSMPGHLLRRLHQHALALYALHSAGFDLTAVQFAALHAIGAWPDRDQSTIGRAIACDKATLGPVLDRLQAKNLIERAADATDRRARRLRATPAGLELLERIAPRVEAVQRDLLAPLTDDEARTLTSLLARLVGTLPGTGEAAE